MTRLSRSYSSNKFAFSAPSLFVRFLKCIGFENMDLLDFRNSIRISHSFFDLDKTHRLQQLWMHCRVGELLLALKENHKQLDVTPATRLKSTLSFNLPYNGHAAMRIGMEFQKNDLWEAILLMHDFLNDSRGIEDILVATNELRGGYSILHNEPKCSSTEGLNLLKRVDQSSFDVPELERARTCRQNATKSVPESARSSSTCSGVANPISEVHVGSPIGLCSGLDDGYNTAVPLSTCKGIKVPAGDASPTEERPSDARNKGNAIASKSQTPMYQLCIQTKL